MRFRKFNNTIRGDDIKRYCKDVDITKIEFIENCCFDYLQGKWKRDDVQKMLSQFSNLPLIKIRQIINKDEKYKLYIIINHISIYISGCINSKKLVLKPIKYYTIIDGMSKKERVIGVQEPLHQIFDYVAVKSISQMTNAKIGVFQCASLPNKGQSYGKKHISKWVNENKTIYFIKGDIRKCFPSISKKRLKELLKRDIKNSTILWLIFNLIDMFDVGLSIGSYLSQYLCNYYLSYAYHYAGEQLFKIRHTKQNGDVRIRLINHVLFYMDDFLITGSSKKDLKKAMKLLIKYFNDFLLLDVKSKWKICKISVKEPIDMMGFVFSKNRTTIRAKIFIKTRRYFLKVIKKLKHHKSISLKLAYQVISGYGWYLNTNSYKIKRRLKLDYVANICKSIISKLTKGGHNDKNRKCNSNNRSIILFT